MQLHHAGQATSDSEVCCSERTAVAECVGSGVLLADLAVFCSNLQPSQLPALSAPCRPFLVLSHPVPGQQRSDAATVSVQYSRATVCRKRWNSSSEPGHAALSRTGDEVSVAARQAGRQHSVLARPARHLNTWNSATSMRSVRHVVGRTVVQCLTPTAATHLARLGLTERSCGAWAVSATQRSTH